MEELLALLKEHKLTIGSCESLTAGLFCAQMASIGGASAVLKGGIVTYATSVKERVVGVNLTIIEQEGVISAACAKEMAEKARSLLDCDICVSFTGNAGPTVMEGKPVGCVYCGIAQKDDVRTYQLQLSGDRNDIREQAVSCMVNEVIKIINQ